jgi:cytoskeletal protein RodZ
VYYFKFWGNQFNMSRQKITLSVLGILAVMLVLIGLFKLGLQSGQRQTATPTQTTKTAPSNSQSQTPTYTKAEYAMMAIMDYNHIQGTQIIDTLTFVEKIMVLKHVIQTAQNR